MAATARLIARLEHQPHGLAVKDADDGDEPTDRERHSDQSAPEPLDLPLERRLALAGLRHRLADPSELGCRAGR
jgi:hypothetical protein